MFSDHISHSIKAARVFCITSILFVHVWPGVILTQDDTPSGALEIIFFILQNEIGRSSVPLLSVISGYLLARSLQSDRSFSQIAGRKVISNVVPLLFWSFILLSMQIVYDFAKGDLSFIQWPILELVNSITGLTSEPINLPLAFLRDTFACALISTALWKLTFNRIIYGLILMTWLVLEEYTKGLLLLRPQILGFYFLGQILWLWGLGSPKINVLFVVATLSLLAVIEMGYVILPVISDSDLVFSYFKRFVVATSFWYLSARTASSAKAMTLIMRLEPMMFALFCSHALTISVMAAALGLLGILPGTLLHLLTVFGQIIMCYLVAWVILNVAAQRFPRVTRLVLGGRPI